MARSLRRSDIRAIIRHGTGYNPAVSQATTESCGEPAVLPVLAREVEEDLARRLAGFDGPEMLREAMAYAVLGGGKFCGRC